MAITLEIAVAELLPTTVAKTRCSGKLWGIFNGELWIAITDHLGQARWTSGTGVVETGSSGQQL